MEANRTATVLQDAARIHKTDSTATASKTKHAQDATRIASLRLCGGGACTRIFVLVCAGPENRATETRTLACDENVRTRKAGSRRMPSYLRQNK